MDIQNQAQQKQQVNMFYEANKANIINADVNTILDSIIESNYKVITKEAFELIGSMAYMYGVDFVSQKQKFNKIVMSNWVIRMKDLNLSPEILTKFEMVLQNVDYDLIGSTKDSLKELLLKEAKFDFNVFKTLKTNIDTIFKASTFKIGFSYDVNELYKLKKYSYGDLLKINKMIYESLVFPGKVFPNLVAIQSNPVYVKNIQKASAHYDLQKFSLIYFESLITLKEFLMIDNKINKEYKVFLTNEEAFELFDVKEEATQEVIQEPTEEVNQFPTNPEEQKNLVDDTDIFIKGVFDEKLEKVVVNLEDLISVQDLILNQEDLVQYVYQFVKNKQKINRKPFNEVFPEINKEAFLKSMMSIFDATSVEYKNLAERYMQEIPTDLRNTIVQYINDIIRSVVIDGEERKAYLLQQFAENQIFTYKQLQQILGLIEECDICGNAINSYISMRDFLNMNDEITNIFDSTVNLDLFQTKIGYYKAIIDFYSDETPTMEVIK